MSDLSRVKVVNEEPGNTRAFGLTLPDDVAAWVEQAARRTGKTAECLLEELVIKSLEEETIPLELRLQRLDGLIKKMLILTKKTPMKEEKDAKGHIHSLEERTKRRENLIELGMKAYEELMKIAADERTSKEAKARLQAFSVMARVGLFNAAVIRDAEDDEIAEFLSELEETDNKMKEELKRLEEKRREEEHDERRY